MIAFRKLKGLYLLLCVLELDLQGIIIGFQGIYLLKGNENKAHHQRGGEWEITYSSTSIIFDWHFLFTVVKN